MIDYTGRRTLLLREGCQEGKGRWYAWGGEERRFQRSGRGRGLPLQRRNYNVSRPPFEEAAPGFFIRESFPGSWGALERSPTNLEIPKRAKREREEEPKGEGAKGGKLCIARSRRHERRGGEGDRNGKREEEGKGIYFDTPFWFLLVYSASILNETLNLIPFAGTGVQDAARTCIYIVYIYSLSG